MSTRFQNIMLIHRSTIAKELKHDTEAFSWGECTKIQSQSCNSDKSEGDWFKLFATLWSCWNVNRDKFFMWHVLPHNLYKYKRASCIGHGDDLYPRECNDTESTPHILFYCHYAWSTWDAVAKLRWGSASHKNIFQQANKYCIFWSLACRNRVILMRELSGCWWRKYVESLG